MEGLKIFRLRQPRLILIATCLAVLLVLLASSALAQEPVPPSDDQVNAIAKQLYCPVCENIPLDVCGTQACAQWRELIREKLSQGWTETQIKQYFVDQYGDRVLAMPPARGLNWAVYILPPVAFVVGAYILFRALKAWRKPAPGAAAAAQQQASTTDEYVRRLEDELKKR